MKTKKPTTTQSPAAGSLLSIADRVAAAGVAPISMAEINAEWKATRAERNKIGSITTMDQLKAEAGKGRRKDFDDFLAKVPNAPAHPTLKEVLLSDVGRVENLTPPRRRR